MGSILLDDSQRGFRRLLGHWFVRFQADRDFQTAFLANPQSMAYAARSQSHECCVKNGTLVPILGALNSVRGWFDSGFGRLPERRPRAVGPVGQTSVA